MPLSDYTKADKNEIISDSLLLLCLDIEIPISLVGETLTTHHVYLVKDNKDLLWQGQTWYGIDFNIDNINETSKGEVPKVVVTVSNTNRIFEAYLQMYDLFTKEYGYYPITVNILVVNTKNVDAYGNLKPDPEINYTFDLKQPQTDDRVATFTLGAPNPYTRRVPLHRMLRNQGRVKTFGDWECGYYIEPPIQHPSSLTYVTTSAVVKGDRFVAISPVNATVLPANTVFNVMGSNTQYRVARIDSYNNKPKVYQQLSQENFALHPGATEVSVYPITHLALKAAKEFTIVIVPHEANPTGLQPTTLIASIPAGATYAAVEFFHTPEIPNVNATGSLTVTGIPTLPENDSTFLINGIAFTFKTVLTVPYGSSGGDGGGGDPSSPDTDGPSSPRH